MDGYVMVGGTSRRLRRRRSPTACLTNPRCLCGSGEHWPSTFCCQISTTGSRRCTRHFLAADGAHPRLSKEGIMAQVVTDADTTASPERVLAALTDFSPQRLELWPNIDRNLYKVN